MDLFLKSVIDILPINRVELMCDVLQRKIYGEISDVWQHPGHLFITTENGSKLFTFDCTPVSHQHVFGTGYLDKHNMSAPLVGIFMISENTALLVNAGCHAFLYNFGEGSSWTLQEEFDLTPTAKFTEILSVAYIPGHKSLVWCEKQSFSKSKLPSAHHSYSVCKRNFSAGFNVSDNNQTSKLQVILHNCPPCQVLALANSVLFISSNCDKEQVTVNMAMDLSSSTASLYVGEDCEDLAAELVQDTLDFQQLMTTHLSSVLKSEPGHGDLGVCSDIHHRQVAVFSSTGDVEIFQHVKGNVLSDGWKVKRRVVNLSDLLTDIPHIEKGHWFLSGRLLGISCGSTFHIVDLKEISLKCTREGIPSPLAIISSQSPAFMAWILTQDDLLALQGAESKYKVTGQLSDTELLPDDHLLQTDILKLAQLQQKKMDSYNLNAIQDLEKLKKLMRERKSSHSLSQLSQIIGPFLEQYWKLDSLVHVLQDRKQPSFSSSDSSVSRFVAQTVKKYGESRTSHHAKLVWLSQVYPQELLECLCEGLSLDSEEVLDQEIPVWQKLLGLDGGDLTHFEFVCRLLFLLHPEKLFNFVKCAESASEKNIGVSAFVRKKQTLVYYKAALDCLPETASSHDPKAAALTKAKFILASGTEICVERSLKYLLRHELWPEAMDMLRKQTDDKAMLPIYLYITVNAMAQSQVLSQYIQELTAIMPTWKSFISFAQVATERPEIRQQQLSNCAFSVFATEKNNVPLGSVKASLMELIKKMNTSQK